MDLFPNLEPQPPEPVDPGALLQLGTSSFSTPDWIGPFYPVGTKPSEFLSVYARRYPVVEIDATYYGVPRARTVAAWDRKTPSWFRLCAKFPRDIVHGGVGPRPDPDVVLDPEATGPVVREFLDVMAPLGAKLGPLVLQFPRFASGSLGPGEFRDRLDAFLGGLPESVRVAVEIRNRSWLTPDFARLLARHRAALVLSDYVAMPLGDELEQILDPVTTDFAYVRLLGDHREMDRLTSTWEREVVDRTDRLRRWSGVLVRLLERRVPTLVFANNHYAGHAPATLEKLRGLVREALEGDSLDPGIE